MESKSSIAALCAAALLIPAGAHAATTTGKAASCSAAYNYYYPPKLIKRGTNSTAIAGPGAVIVQVLVHKDGSFKVQRVLKSSNHGDDQAALEIAQTSTYKPACKAGKTLLAFYDFTLNFAGGGTASTEAEPGELPRIERMLNAGNFSGAQSAVNDYLKAHPDDAKAELLLGIADTFLNDYESATAAFDKAGEIPQKYRSVAGKAYVESVNALVKAKKTDAAIAAAHKAVQFAPGFATYNILGIAEYSSNQYAIAATDFEKAREAAAKSDSGASAALRAQIDLNLGAAYLNAGNVDAGLKAIAEANQLDPSVAKNGDVLIANYYVSQAKPKIDAKKYGDAAELLEKAALAAPSQAAGLYAQASSYYLLGDKPDNAKALADADKALALDANSTMALYAKGIAFANNGKTKDALDYLQKADDAAKKSGDTAFAGKIEDQIKRLKGGR